MLLPSLVEAVWFILPAYIANSMAINVSGLPILKAFKTPVDFGLSWRGKRILGDGKTWRGWIAGTLFAGLTAAFQQQYPQPGLFPMTVSLGLLLGCGAMVGDMAESMLKRRMGMDRGHPLFILDQTDYIFGAFFFAWLIVPVDLGYLALTLFITVPIHFVCSAIAWIVGLKKNPW
jgi:CDP-2,3-bis-(O-geranylgeranyl)-sn-glycerol synthase